MNGCGHCMRYMNSGKWDELRNKIIAHHFLNKHCDVDSEEIYDYNDQYVPMGYPELNSAPRMLLLKPDGEHFEVESPHGDEVSNDMIVERLVSEIQNALDEPSTMSPIEGSSRRFSKRNYKKMHSKHHRRSMKHKRHSRHTKKHSRRHQKGRGLFQNLVMAGALLGTASSALRSKKTMTQIKNVSKGVTGAVTTVLKPVEAVLKPVTGVAEGVARGSLKVLSKTEKAVRKTVGLNKKKSRKSARKSRRSRRK